MTRDPSREPLAVARTASGTWQLPHAGHDRIGWIRSHATLLAGEEDAVAACEELLDEALSDVVRSVTAKLDPAAPPTVLVRALRDLGEYAEAAEAGQCSSGREAMAAIAAIARTNPAIQLSRSRPMTWIAFDFPRNGEAVAAFAKSHLRSTMASRILPGRTGATRVVCATTEPAANALTSAYRRMRLTHESPFATGPKASWIPTGAYPLLAALPFRLPLRGGLGRACALPVSQKGSRRLRMLTAKLHDLAWYYMSDRDSTRLALPSRSDFADDVVEAADAYAVQCGGTPGDLAKQLGLALEWHADALRGRTETSNP